MYVRLLQPFQRSESAVEKKTEFLLHEATKTEILLLGPKYKFRLVLMFNTDGKFEFSI